MPGIPFDAKRGIIPNLNGKVSDAPGVYVCGWIKRGPSGIIGTNKYDAEEVITTIVDDLKNTFPLKNAEGDFKETASSSTPENGTLSKPLDSIREILASRNVKTVSFSDWLVLNEEELKNGAAKSKAREKVKTVPEMMRIIESSSRL